MPLAADEFAGLTHVGSGKVRELFAVGDDAILLVASDRISAFDWVLPTEIPDKGAVLTALSLFWFDLLAEIVPGHVVTAKVDEYPPELKPYAEQLRGRSMLCKRLSMVEYAATFEVSTGCTVLPRMRRSDASPDAVTRS